MAQPTFEIGDRIRITQFFGLNTSSMVGMTGTVTKRVEGASYRGYLYSYHVKLDRPAKAVPGYSKQDSLTFLMHPEELEYEDNRKGAVYYDKIAYNNDYVRLSADLGYRACETKFYSPLTRVFKLFSNVRVGDSAIILKCINCGEVLASSRYSGAVTPDGVENYMYDNNQPSWPDVNTRVE